MFDFTVTELTLSSALDWRGICHDGAVFCAFADNADVVAVSVDGASWTEYDLPSVGPWGSIAASASAICIIGKDTNSSQVVTSLDHGQTWTAHSTAPAVIENPSDLVWNGSLFFSFNRDDSETVTTSPDGINWTYRGINFSFGETVISEVFSDGSALYMLGYGDDVTLYSLSNDASSFSQVDTATAEYLRPCNIVWNGEFYCTTASGDDATSASKSIDGLDWTTHSTGISVDIQARLVWDGNAFVTANFGSQTGATSEDGEAWSTLDLLADLNWTGIATDGAGNSIAIATGTDFAALITSSEVEPEPEPLPEIVPVRTNAQLVEIDYEIVDKNSGTPHVEVDFTFRPPGHWNS